MKIPFLNFNFIHSEIRTEILDTFSSVYDSNWFVMGKYLETFEKEYSDFNKVKHSIGVSNGLDALYLSLKALGITNGDHVLVPSNTYIATPLAVSFTGATPIFVEPNINTYNIDVNQIKKAKTKKTKAIIPVHLYGQACEMESIMNFSKYEGIYVIEDNAQAHGASFNGKLTGSWGHASGTSFYPGKNLGALGDGGMITTNNDNVANELKLLRNYGSKIKYEHEVIGHNMRLDEIQAAFLSIKLKKLLKWTTDRQKIANWYTENLNDLSQLVTPYVHKDASHSYHLYVIRTNKRDQLQNYLAEQGISTLIHYPNPPHLQKAYKSLGYKLGSFPISEELSRTSLSLPLWPGMTFNEVEYVCNRIKLFFQKNQN